MLETIEIKNYREKNKILNDFHPKNSLWITSDIKSRLFVLDRLQCNHPILNTNCVLRATDFWISLLRINDPQIQVVPKSLLVLMYQKWAQSQKEETWVKHINTGTVLCHYMDAFSHLFTHPQRDSLIQEWMEKRARPPHWRQWYKLGIEFWEYLKQKKTINYSWCSSLLLDHIPFPYLKWDEIIFDMGFDIYPIEAEIILQISTKTPVKVLIPVSYENGNRAYSHLAYNTFKTNNYPKRRNTFFTSNSISVKSFASPLAEIKNITGQIRKTLDKGVSLQKITVLAPHIEPYWVCLKKFLKLEGIPVCKRDVVPLSSFYPVQLWLSIIKTHLSIIKYENLETIKSHSESHTDFNQFKSRFYYINYREQVPSELIKRDLLKNQNEMIRHEDFVSWILKFYPEREFKSFLFQSIKNCLTEFLKLTKSFQKESLSAITWLRFLESIIQTEEIIINEEQPHGIQCLSFNALSWVQSDFIYVAGLSEQNLKPEKHNFISDIDTESIEHNLGFFFKIDDPRKSERMISQLIQQDHKEIILSFSRSDFQGAPLNPSRFWLENAKQQKVFTENTDTPCNTLWDFHQRQKPIQNILKHRNINDRHIKLIEQSIKEDTGLQPIDDFFPKCNKQMSPSVLNEYAKCPFIFASKYIFRLCDEPDRDMDFPSTYRGKWIHKLFEILKQTKKPLSSDKEILQIIEEIKQEFKKDIQWLQPAIWEKEKRLLLKKANLFLEHERTKTDRMKKYKAIAYEKEFNFYWNRETQSMNKQGTIPFKGKIDRIDSDGSSYIVIDYKGRLSSGTVAPSWNKYNNFQMALYVCAVELGLPDLKALPVNGALYASYKDFQYKGLALKEIEPLLTGNKPKNKTVGPSRLKSLVTSDKKKTDSTGHKQKSSSNHLKYSKREV